MQLGRPLVLSQEKRTKNWLNLSSGPGRPEWSEGKTGKSKSAYNAQNREGWNRQKLAGGRGGGGGHGPGLAEDGSR